MKTVLPREQAIEDIFSIIKFTILIEESSVPMP